MRLFTSLVTVVCLAGVSGPLQGQETKPDSVAVEAATKALQSDLRNYVTAQESYFADNATYAGSFGQMTKFFKPSRDVTVVLLTSSNKGHSEVAIHAKVPGLVCATYVGHIPAPLGRGDEGQVVCSGP